MSIFLTLVAAAAADTSAIVELKQEEEMLMALAAAPDHLRDGAGVYVLGKHGYVAARPSSNGFNCLVAREPNSGTGPVCYDPEGSATLLKADLMRGELQRAGKTEKEVSAAIAVAYAAKKLMAPRRAGVAYMLSTDFRQISPKTGKPECIYPPHIMIYAPYLKNSAIGSAKKFGSTTTPWVLNEGKPNAYIILVHPHADVAACT